MKRHLLSAAGFGLGYLFVVLLERALLQLERDQAAAYEASRAAREAELAAAGRRQLCLCSRCQEGRAA